MENCERFEPMFDQMMDDALTDADRAKLDAHCADCPACAEKRRATAALKRMFSELPPEEDVPLKLQAGWRGAVKAEAGRSRRRMMVRWAGGIAAALVLAVGGVFALRGGTVSRKYDAPMLNAERSVAVIEADGQSVSAKSMVAEVAEAVEAEMDDYEEVSENAAEEAADMAMAAGAAPVCERRMTVEDLNRTCAYMADLAAEYEGTLEDQRYEANGAACASLFVDLPAENAADFLSAAAHYGTGAGSDDGQPTALDGRVSILLILTETTEVQEK